MLLSEYSYNCAKILGNFEFGNALSYKNAFLITKRIQCFAYFMASFEGLSILRGLFEGGVIEFCKNSIIFGFKFIEINLDNLLLLKSIRGKYKTKGS